MAPVHSIPPRRAALLTLVLLGAPPRLPPVLAVIPTIDRGQPATPIAYIDPVVPAALASRHMVDVIVMLRPTDPSGGNGSARRSPAPAVDLNGVADLAAIASAQAALLRALGPMDFQPSYRYRAIPALAGRLTTAGLSKLVHHPVVRAVGPDLTGSGGLASSVPHIRADRAHALGLTGRGIRVAVLDTGVDAEHPDLAGRIADEACIVQLDPGCLPGDHAAADDHGHGTNVAGIVASAGAISAPGVAPGAEIVAIKVMNKQNRFVTSDVLAGLDRLIGRRDLRAVNLSLGTDTRYRGACDDAGAVPQAFAAAIGALRAQGTLAVVASMNGAPPGEMPAPACVRDALTVGAVYDAQSAAYQVYAPCVDPTAVADRIACFSNSGTMLDLLAPGVAVTAPYPHGGLGTFTGTSQAAPHVTGAIALLAERFPEMSPGRIEAVLKGSGVPLTDLRTGVTAARIDVARAIEVGEAIPLGQAHMPWLGGPLP